MKTIFAVAALLALPLFPALAADVPPGPPEGACCHIGNAEGVTHLGEYGWRCMIEEHAKAAAACAAPAAPNSPKPDTPAK